MSKPAVLITGASSGIGAVYADRFARRGHDVILVARDVTRLWELTERLRRETSTRAELLVADQGEERGCKEFRKHVSWYLKGFRAGGELRHSLALVDSLATLDELLARLDPDEAFPVGELGRPRGRQGAPRRSVALPEGWLAARDNVVQVVREEAAETSGG